MPVFKLNEQTSDVLGGESTQKNWFAKDTLSSIATSPNIFIIPTGIRYVLASVAPDVGVSAYIEYTLSSLDDINNSIAVWKAWDNGIVNSYTDITFNPPTAIRLVVVAGAGSCRMDIKAG